MEKVIHFLSQLQKNNERDWFHAHKSQYTECREIFLGTVEGIIRQLQLTDSRLQNLDPKDTMFRINRDIRFSNDKSPYKTHFGAYMAKGGRKSSNAGYYLHIGSDGSFIGGGVYHPEKEELKVIRQEIIYQPEKYTSLVKSVEKTGFALMEEEKLKTGPKGFDKDSPHIDLIKYKNYIFSRSLSDDELSSPQFEKLITKYFISLYPYTDFLNTAMDFMGNE